MNNRDEHPQKRGRTNRSAIPKRVAKCFYSYGLLASSCPFCIIGVCFLIALLTCYPLSHLPVLGSSPTITSSKNVTGSNKHQPFCYIQQLVMRSAVMPWQQHLLIGDAFRAPLYESFKLLDAVRNYEETQSGNTLGHVCFHVEAIKRNRAVDQDILPQYSCLVLSPANLWQQNIDEFAKDASLLSTIFKQQNFQRGKTSIAEMLFGMRMVDTGIKRYPFRNRRRIIQYSVTLFLKDYDESFINGLRQRLATLYPLHQNNTELPQLLEDNVLVYYPDEMILWNNAPLIIAFIVLFIYYYFSIRKVEVVKSKILMTFTVVFTIWLSMMMSLGIAFFFGQIMSKTGEGIYPFISLIVGTENVLVLTKSIISTPAHLDAKIRIAQALSKEGWSILKTLLLELTIATIGLFTFVPSIQEFCIFGIITLTIDLFLQLTFFIVIFAIDLKKMEDSNEKFNPNFRTSLLQNQVFYDGYNLRLNSTQMSRSKSHPRLSVPHTDVVAGVAQGVQDKRIPKRLRLVNIWARTRFFQRSIMLLLAVWISMIAYESDLLNYSSDSSPVTDFKSAVKMFPLLDINKSSYVEVNYDVPPSKVDRGDDYTDDLKHSGNEPWKNLRSYHWSSILKKYNVSLSSRYITILPTIKLSHLITPENAIAMRNPNEKYGETFQWQALAAALDPMEFAADRSSVMVIPTEQPYFPSSPMEIVLISFLCVLSVIVLIYMVVVIVRFVWSRNYVDWFNNEKSEESEGESQVLLEAVPMALEGHQQDIEWLVSDGNIIVSCCLEGIFKIWDNNRGELLASIDRNAYFGMGQKAENFEHDDRSFSDYESGSPPSRDETLPMFPRLMHKIDTNFSSIQSESPPSTLPRYNFHDSFRRLYTRNASESGVKNRLKGIDWLEDVVGKETSDNITSIDMNEDASTRKVSPIWCMACLDNLIVIGCADGHMEFWEGTTARLKCFVSEDSDGIGITHIRILGSRVVAARLYGSLDFFILQTYNHGRPIDWNFTVAYRRTHVRTGSQGSVPDRSTACLAETAQDELKCTKLTTIWAHQQPITCLECASGAVLTGSQDHTVKLIKLEDGQPLYTLHGHCGPITCMFIDELKPSISGSGSQDGTLCTWDLSTGTCLYNVKAHNGCITSLAYSPSYVISIASDDKLCVWERFQGHLLTKIEISQTFASPIAMLAPHLVVTAQANGLVIWDVRSGQCVRTIQLGRLPYVFIKQMVLLRDAVLCDYGHELRVVRFPLITHKFD